MAYRDNLSQVSVALQEFDVTKEIERALEVVDYLIDVKVLQGSSRIMADPRRTRQILRNLVSNAMRYGGDQIQISLAKAGDRPEVKIQDSGKAIPDGDVERIFRATTGRRGTPHSASEVGLRAQRRPPPGRPSWTVISPIGTRTDGRVHPVAPLGPTPGPPTIPACASLVTGGADLHRSHTVASLIEAGHEPVIVDNLANAKRSVVTRIGRIAGREPEFVEADVAISMPWRRSSNRDSTLACISPP